MDRGGGGGGGEGRVHYTPSAPHQRPLPSPPPSTLPEDTIPSSPPPPDNMVQRLMNQVDQLRFALAQSQEEVK